MEHPTVLKNPYNCFYPLGFILVLVAQFDYETVYYIYKPLCELSNGSSVISIGTCKRLDLVISVIIAFLA